MKVTRIVEYNRIESRFLIRVSRLKDNMQNVEIDVKLSIAFHSETNDQSEIANQEMKRYLRSYCNYQQDD